MGNRGTDGRLALGPRDIDMDPLIVAGGPGELVDPFLGDLDPVAHADLHPNHRFDFVKVLEDPHRAHCKLC